ncbi:MAG: DUF6284 family protein [Nocardioides sp.]
MSEPSAGDLRAIEAEWPVIAAELAVVEVECRIAAGRGGELGGRALRRVVGRRLLALTACANAEAASRGPRSGRAGSVVDLPVPAVDGWDGLVSRIECGSDESTDIEGAI